MAVCYQTYSENLLNGGTVSGATPATGYTASTLLSQNPAAHVRYSSGTVTVTVTAPSSVRGDVFCLPMHNLSGAVLTLTNGAGLSEAITIPSAMASGLPQTLVADLTALEPNASTRTSSVWNLVISGNASNVILGGAIAVYTSLRTTTSIQTGFVERETHHTITHDNIYGTTLRYDLSASSRRLEGVMIASDAEMITIRDWFRAGHGLARPSLLWVDTTDLSSAVFGCWDSEFAITREFRNRSIIPLVFKEAGRGVSFV